MSGCADYVTVLTEGSAGQPWVRVGALQCTFVHSFVYLALELVLYVEIRASCQGIKTMGPGSSKRAKHHSVLTQDPSTSERRCPQYNEGSRDVRSVDLPATWRVGEDMLSGLSVVVAESL